MLKENKQMEEDQARKAQESADQAYLESLVPPPPIPPKAKTSLAAGPTKEPATDKTAPVPTAQPGTSTTTNPAKP